MPGRTTTAARRARLASLVVTTAVAASLLVGAPVQAGAAGVDAATEPAAVAVPVLDWGPCPEEGEPTPGTFECAVADVPLDYDRPGGPSVGIALKRHLAGDPQRRIGSLFVNPGGPGGSGVELVSFSEFFLLADVLDRFDIVGFDPRGVARSDPLLCFDSLAEGIDFITSQPPFPVTWSEDRAFARAFAGYTRECAGNGGPIMSHMSTANVARDLDLLRAAVGDDQLTYFGGSYGTQLGNTYANMFPDNVRALVLDGVLDPIAWTTGRSAAEGRLVPFSTRLRSDAGAYATLLQFFDQCEKAGPDRCALAKGDPRRRYEALARQLRRAPMEIEVEGEPLLLTYPVLVSFTLDTLYDPFAWPYFAELTDAVAPLRDARSAGRAFTALKERLEADGPEDEQGQTIEGLTGVSCTDSTNPHNWRAWSVNGRLADLRSPYFGRGWTWFSIPCATWPVRDRDRYTGPWTATTANPVLLVGNRYDPATPYHGAQTVAGLLPGSRLLTLDGWGHTAFGLSTCVEEARTAYLVDLVLPPVGAVCRPDLGPFDLVGARQAAALGLQERMVARREMLGDLTTQPL